MAHVFDLTENPFAILGVTIRTRQGDIVSAYEDALSDHKHPEALLGKAQQALLTPKSRLEAELTWLPSTSPATVRKIQEFIDDALYDDAAALMDDMVGLDKANLAADLCCRDSTGVGHAKALVSAYGDIDLKDILNTLTDNRSVSGFSRIDPTMLETGLGNLRKTHAKAAMEFLKEEIHPAESMLEIVEEFNDEPGDNVKLILGDIAREYDAWSEVPLRIVRDKIDKEIAALKDDPRNEAGYAKLTKLLEEWDVYSQPIQLIEESKGHDEPKSRALFEEIRKFCLWLANEEGEHERALRISKDMLRIFPELPSVAIRVQEDVEALERISRQAGVASHEEDESDDDTDDESSRRAEAALNDPNLAALTVALDEASKSVDRLILDIIHGGFSGDSQGIAKKLYLGFTSSVEKSRNTANRDLPWIALINLAVRISNEHSAHSAAEALLRGALHFSRNFDPGVDIMNSIRGELNGSVVAQLLERFKATTDRKTKANLAKQISDLSRGEVAKQFSAVYHKLQGQIFWMWVRRIVFAGIAIAIIGSYLNDNKSKKPRYTPSTTATTPTYTPSVPATPSQPVQQAVPAPTPEPTPAPATSGVALWSWLKSAPPGLPNAVLSRDQLRYCIFQGEVIDSLRLMVNDGDNDKFNAMVVAFNNACAEFKYYERDMTAVNRELNANRDLIHQAASETADRWHGVGTSLNALLPTKNDLKIYDGAIAVQFRLRLAGYYSGILDGKWGPGSAAALVKWKIANNFPANALWTRDVEIKLMGE